jgi:hypothetical protein
MLSLASGRRAETLLLRPLEAEFERVVNGCQGKTTIWDIELMVLGIDQEHVGVIHDLGGP